MNKTDGGVKMRYLAMLFINEADVPASDAERQRVMDQYVRFSEDARQAGVFVAGEALQPVETATVVRTLENGPSITDGPFTETKEAIAGFYLLECDNLDQAIEWASKIPAARHGAVEVRPVFGSVCEPEAGVAGQ